jgi:large subunit ribosomal protein L13
MKTYSPKASEVQREWHVIDATNKTLGEIGTQAAILLRGKHKPMFSPHLDTGDYVIVINAAKIRVTGNKLEDKIYNRHTGYPGGLRSTPLGKMLKAHPTRPIEQAVKGMLPHNSLGRAMIGKLKVYPGETHPHEAQVSKAKV